jgi:hypothetical protein
VRLSHACQLEYATSSTPVSVNYRVGGGGAQLPTRNTILDELWPALLRHASLERQVIERFNALLKRLFGCSTGWEEGMMQEDTQGWERPKCQTLVDGICGKERCGDHTAAKDGESEMEEPLTIL